MNITNIVAILLWSLVFIRGKRVIKDRAVTILSLIFLINIIFNCLFNN